MMHPEYFGSWTDQRLGRRRFFGVGGGRGRAHSFRDGFVGLVLLHDLADCLVDIIEARPSKLSQHPACDLP
jgi:hypothetical protein